MEQIAGILFIDIETVPIEPDYANLTEPLQKEWLRKAKTLRGEDVAAGPEEAFALRAGVFAEFAKVVCIGIGNIVEKDKEYIIRLKALTGTDERLLLQQFAEVLGRFCAYHPDMRFCGHNIKEFDVPFLSRRMMINGLPLPGPMQLQNKKPWEIPHADTLELWKFGDYKNYTSLSLLATVLGLPSPKGDIDGSMVGQVYYQDGDLNRIGRYCLQDVLTTAKVYLKLTGRPDMALNPVIVEG